MAQGARGAAWPGENYELSRLGFLTIHFPHSSWSLIFRQEYFNLPSPSCKTFFSTPMVIKFPKNLTEKEATVV